MTQPNKPSDKFGVARNPDGSVLVEFRTPYGAPKSRVLFDQEAAVEFVQALLAVVLDTEPTR